MKNRNTGPNHKENSMTKRIGNKDIAQHRGKEEKKRLRGFNLAMEAEKKAIAAAKYRNQVKGRPELAAQA
jgi:hypothetical protein